MKIKQIAIIIFTAICLAGCNSPAENTDAEVVEESVDLPVQHIKYSFAYAYADIAEMAQDSDLIALIKVDELSDKSSGSTSVFNVTVTEAIHGCEQDQALEITMKGGRAKYAIVIVPEDPLMEAGQEFLILAKKSEDGTYSVCNGQWGRFLYKDGLLTALQYTDLPENPGGGFEVKDKPVEEMIQEIKDALE